MKRCLPCSSPGPVAGDGWRGDKLLLHNLQNLQDIYVSCGRGRLEKAYQGSNQNGNRNYL
ncbi:hypothetical protein DsansV1_C06g0067991 [Dioscorea sansibarensis]